METNFVVLNNVLNGLFITHHQTQHAFDERTNPQVPAYDEIIILKEYSKVVFTRGEGEAETAESPSFYFYKFNEDALDDITWVETKGVTILPE